MTAAEQGSTGRPAMTAASPRAGTFGLSRIGGVLGAFVAAGQAFTGDGSRYTHAFVVVDGGYVVEAMPSGARLAPLADRVADRDVRWCDAPVRSAIEGYEAQLSDPLDAQWDNHPVTRQARLDSFERNLRAALAAEARDLVGARYGFSDYLALTLAHFGIRAAWLRRYIARSGRLICSQLCDEVYLRQGIHLFDDGRLPMDVTPGDLDAYRAGHLEEVSRG